MKAVIGFILCLVSTVSFSQGIVEILDVESNVPVVAAQVTFFQNNNFKDSLVLFTDADGIVLNPIKSDTVFIKIKSLGYEDFTGEFGNLNHFTIRLKPKDHYLGTTVITGQYSPNTKSNSIYNIEVVNENEIEEKGATNMQEVLNNQLSFKTNNGHTNETSLNINGLSGAHVKFMIDGVPVEGRVNGNIDLSQINTNDIESIEIIEGPVSVIYGTNAIGGIVNIITKKNTQKKIESFVNSYYETVGKYNLSGGVGFKQNNNNIKISGGRNFFSGFSDNDTSRSLLWKPREQYFGKILIGHKFKKFNLSITANTFHEKMISKGELKPPYYTTAFDVYNKTDRFTNRLLFNGYLNKKSYLDFTFGYSYYKRQRNIYYKDLTTLESFLTDGNSDQDTTIYNNFIFRGFYSNKVKKDKFSYLVGTEFKQDFIHAGRVQNQNQNIGNYAIYGSIKYQPFKNIIIQPSLRYAYNTRYRAPIIPSVIVQLNYKSLKLKGFYAKGFRTPSLKELYLEFHYNETINLWGNENLSAENSDHFMLSGSYEKNDFKLETKVFYNKIRDLIDLVKISDIDWKYDNIGYFITKGANISANYSHKSIQVNLGYSYIGTYDGQFSAANFKNQFNYNSNLSADIRYIIKKWDAGITANYKFIGQTNSFYLTDNGTIENSYIGKYQIVDFTLFKRFFEQKLTIVGGVKNLLNTTEVDLAGNIYGFSTSKNADKLAVLWGRTAFVSLKINL